MKKKKTNKIKKVELASLDMLVPHEWYEEMKTLAQAECLPTRFFLRARLTERVRNSEYIELPNIPILGERTRRTKLAFPVDVKEKLIEIKERTESYSLALVIMKIAAEEIE